MAVYNLTCIIFLSFFFKCQWSYLMGPFGVTCDSALTYFSPFSAGFSHI